MEIFKYDVFISFSSKDEKLAKNICQELAKYDLKVFYSNTCLRQEAGDSWFDIIQTSLENSQHMLLICTDNSMDSVWVKREYSAFFSYFYQAGSRKLIPILSDNYNELELPLFLRELQTLRYETKKSLSNIDTILGTNKLTHKKESNYSLKYEKHGKLKNFRSNPLSNIIKKYKKPRTHVNKNDKEITNNTIYFNIINILPINKIFKHIKDHKNINKSLMFKINLSLLNSFRLISILIAVIVILSWVILAFIWPVIFPILRPDNPIVVIIVYVFILYISWLLSIRSLSVINTLLDFFINIEDNLRQKIRNSK